ncbi:MAG: 50S ribosomal protein L16 [Candidatus Aenigmarchaeota archaeon]|nr:50S ribosomal protein L16 [Candidatus Aenigmarchaeota archaeon]
MATLRPGRSFRSIERPSTRCSVKKTKSYIPTMPPGKLHQFMVGEVNGTFDTKLKLVAREPAQIRDNAMEAARIVATNFLEKKAPKGYFLKFLLYPHQIIREKPIAQGAGADRYSRGMKLAFGKPAGKAVQIQREQTLLTLQVNKNNLVIGKQALKKASLKLSTPMRIVVE